MAGPSALVDLANDVTDVLPIVHGGTGINGVGANGTVLVSTGSGLAYRFVIAQDIGYTPAVPGNWSGSPATTQQALDRMAALLNTLNGGPIP